MYIQTRNPNQNLNLKLGFSFYMIKSHLMESAQQENASSNNYVNGTT